jgi:hypothetical protein
VDDGVREPTAARQLRERAAYALHAAAGLDRGKRAELEGLLARRLAEKSLPGGLREDVALAAAELGSLTPQAAGLVTRHLTQAITRESDFNALRRWVSALFQVAPRLEPAEAGAAADALGNAMAHQPDPYRLYWLAQALSAVCGGRPARTGGGSAAGPHAGLGSGRGSRFAQAVLASGGLICAGRPHGLRGRS